MDISKHILELSDSLKTRSLKSLDYEDKLENEKYLNSSLFNDIFNAFEEDLNSLYEQIRIAEDIISYCKKYIDKKIEELSIKKNLLNSLETERSSIKNNTYSIVTVPLQKSNEPVIDRDGKQLNICNIINNQILLHEKHRSEIKIDNITKECKYYPNISNTENLKIDKAYTTLYLMDQVIPGGVTEKLAINFKMPEDINLIDTKLINCMIEKIECIDKNDNKTVITDFKDGHLTLQQVLTLHFYLRATDYQVRGNSAEILEVY